MRMERLVGVGSCFISSNRRKTKFDRRIRTGDLENSDTDPPNIKQEGRSEADRPGCSTCGIYSSFQALKHRSILHRPNVETKLAFSLASKHKSTDASSAQMQSCMRPIRFPEYKPDRTLYGPYATSSHAPTRWQM